MKFEYTPREFTSPPSPTDPQLIECIQFYYFAPVCWALVYFGARGMHAFYEAGMNANQRTKEESQFERERALESALSRRDFGERLIQALEPAMQAKAVRFSAIQRLPAVQATPAPFLRSDARFEIEFARLLIDQHERTLIFHFDYTVHAYASGEETPLASKIRTICVSGSKDESSDLTEEDVVEEILEHGVLAMAGELEVLVLSLLSLSAYGSALSVGADGVAPARGDIKPQPNRRGIETRAGCDTGFLRALQPASVQTR